MSQDAPGFYIAARHSSLNGDVRKDTGLRIGNWTITMDYLCRQTQGSDGLMPDDQEWT